MIKPTAMAAREPIYLTKLKKKVRNCENVPPVKGQGIEYDLQIFQESLNIQKNKVVQNQEGKVLQDRGIQDLQGSYRTCSENLIPGKWIGKCNLNQTVTIIPAQSMPQKAEPLVYYTSAHKAVATLKPNTSEVINKENAILYQPQLASLKARTVQTITKSKAEALKEIHSAMQEGNHYDFKQSNCEIACSLQFQNRVKELELKNQEAQLKIAELEAKLKQKEGVSERVQKLEQEMSMLYEEKIWLQKNIAEPKFQMEIQTEFTPLYVQDAYCQTQAYDPDYHHRMSEMRRSEGSFPRQLEYKTIIENIHIENRLTTERLIRQLETMTMKYESKCKEVQEKEELINRYCFRKHDDI